MFPEINHPAKLRRKQERRLHSHADDAEAKNTQAEFSERPLSNQHVTAPERCGLLRSRSKIVTAPHANTAM